MIGGSKTDPLVVRARKRGKPKRTPLILIGVGWALASTCSAAAPAEIATNPTPVTTSASPIGPPPREMTSTPTEAITSPAEPLDSPLDSPLALEIRSAYQTRYEAYWGCLRTPVDCDDSYLWPAGPAAQHMTTVRAELVARDRHVGSGPVGYHKVEQIQIAADLRIADVTACWWSTAILYGAPIYPELPVSADNPLSLVSSTPEGGRQRDRFLRHEGSWFLVSSTPLDQGFAGDPCNG
jgi:hypothetical protein